MTAVFILMFSDHIGTLRTAPGAMTFLEFFFSDIA